MKIRLGLIGCGSIGAFHSNAYKNISDRVEFVACCDLIEDRAKYFSERYGWGKYYTDVDTMMAECDLDAVSVCTWNSAHKECTVKALRAGAHVLCEKPMAMNTAEAEEMLATAKEMDRLLMIGFVRRHGNDAATALDFIEKGYLGDVYHMKASYIRRKGFPGNWFGDKEYSGGGPLIDLGVHIIDLCRYLAGNPKPVTVYGVTFDRLGPLDNIRGGVSAWAAQETVKKPKFNVEDMALATIRFDNGMVLTAEASFSLFVKEDFQKIELFGTKAGLDLGTFTLHSTCNDMMADIKIRGNVGEGDFFTEEMRNFLDSIEGKAPCKAPGEDGVELMRILDAIYESAATGKSVDIVR